MKIYDSTGFDAKLTGSFSGSFIGEVVGTSSIASTASYIELANVDGSASLAQSISSNSSSIASLEAVSGSYANSASFATDIFNNSASIASLESNSGSYLLNSTDTFTGDLTVTGEVIAQTLNVQQVTSSIVYSSGSNIFGDDASDVHQFTGSIRMGADSDLTVGRTLYANQIDSGTGVLNINSESGFNAINLGSTYTYTDKLRVSQIQSTVGTGSINIDNSGNVGVGTNNPSSALDITGAISLQNTSIPSAGTARIFSRDTNSYLYLQTGGGNQIQLLDSSQNTLALFNPSLISFSISNSEAMRIDSSGNVGIGTQNANLSSSDIALTVNSTADSNAGIEISDGGTLAGVLFGKSTQQVGLWAVPNIYMTFATDNTERLRIDSSGRLIKKNGEGLQFERSFSDLTPPNDSQGLIYQREGYSSGADTLIFASRAHAFQSHLGGEYMHIDSSGRVGIGTAGLTNTLHVHASEPIIRINSTLSTAAKGLYFTYNNTLYGRITHNANSGQLLITSGESGQTGYYMDFNVNGSNALRIGSDGNATFSKSDDMRVSITDTGDSSTLVLRADATNEIYTNTNHDLQIYTNGNQNGQLYLKQSNGNVGINRTSPVSILELGDDTPTLTISDTGNNYNDGDVQSVVHLSGRWYSGESNPNADLYSDARMVLRKDHTDGTGGSSLGFEISGVGATGLLEVMRITKEGRLGVRTDTPSGVLHVLGDYYLQNGNMSVTQNYGITWNNGDNYIKGIGGYHLQFTTYDGSSAQNEVLRLTGGSTASGGARAGIGQTVPAAKLDVNGDVAIAKNIGWYNATSILNAGTLYWNKLGTWNTSQGGYNLHLEVHGGVGYNANDGQQSVAHIYFRTSNGSSTNNGMYADGYYYIEGASNIFTQVVAKEISSSEYEFYVYTNTFTGNPHVEAHCARGTSWDNDGSQNTGSPTGTTSSLSEYYYIHSPTTISSDINIAGSLTKGSGTFKIDHPLEEKSETHYLVHSFVESPKTDLLYRGKSTLVSGSVSIDIDDYVGMTPGTFNALVDDTQVFTTNESNWDLVKGSISSSILTIESQNANSTAEISWLVIGDRKDPHIIETSWTDENGKPILEPLKS